MDGRIITTLRWHNYDSQLFCLLNFLLAGLSEITEMNSHKFVVLWWWIRIHQLFTMAYIKRHSHYVRCVRDWFFCMKTLCRGGHRPDPRRIRAALHICRISADEFDLTGQRTRIPRRVVCIACECVYTNQRDRWERIRSGSVRTTRCWADTHRLRA